MVVVQYTDKINTKKLNFLMRSRHGQSHSAKAMNMRVAPEEIAVKLTGYGMNGVTPIGMLQPIPVIITMNISKLNPPLLYLGAGHPDWKIALPIEELMKCTISQISDLAE